VLHSGHLANAAALVRTRRPADLGIAIHDRRVRPVAPSGLLGPLSVDLYHSVVLSAQHHITTAIACNVQGVARTQVVDDPWRWRLWNQSGESTSPWRRVPVARRRVAGP
jgi:hypothetical protein